MSKLTLLFCILLSVQSIHAQVADSIKYQKRFQPLLLTTGVAYGLSITALNELWYDDFERESFHFFNDNHEWKQMDKAGHFYSAFQLSAISYSALKWSGLKEPKAYVYGSVASLLVLTSIEVLDGHSAAYGASWGDVVANTSGALFFYGQSRLWGEIRIQPKFSFARTHYPQHRPEMLGHNLAGELLKDYNAQTYWLSADLSKFCDSFPKWMNLAIGYGAHDMVFAEDHSNTSAGYAARRQFYLAIDLDLSDYKSKSKIVNGLLYIINMIHLPAPALEYSAKKFKFHPLY